MFAVNVHGTFITNFVIFLKRRIETYITWNYGQHRIAKQPVAKKYYFFMIKCFNIYIIPDLAL